MKFNITKLLNKITLSSGAEIPHMSISSEKMFNIHPLHVWRVPFKLHVNLCHSLRAWHFIVPICLPNFVRIGFTLHKTLIKMGKKYTHVPHLRSNHFLELLTIEFG